MGYISPIPTEYDGYRFRSRLEARWAVFFKSIRTSYYYEYQGYETKSGRYLPDFYIPAWDMFVEVKPEPISRSDWSDIRKFFDLCNGLSKRGIVLVGIPQPDIKAFFVDGNRQSALYAVALRTFVFGDAVFCRDSFNSLMIRVITALPNKDFEDYTRDVVRYVDMGLSSSEIGDKIHSEIMGWGGDMLERVAMILIPLERHKGVPELFVKYLDGEVSTESDIRFYFNKRKEDKYFAKSNLSEMTRSVVRGDDNLFYAINSNAINSGKIYPCIEAYNNAKSARFEHGESPSV